MSPRRCVASTSAGVYGCHRTDMLMRVTSACVPYRAGVPKGVVASVFDLLCWCFEGITADVSLSCWRVIVDVQLSWAG